MSTLEKIYQLCLLLVAILLSTAFMRPVLTQSLDMESEDSKIRCLEMERLALLDFKKELIDENGMLSSWGEEGNKRDCCRWRGVLCNNITNRVVRLDLRANDDVSEFEHSQLKGNISLSLIQLQDLNYLDLSGNDFCYTSFPGFIGSLTKLRYLNLSFSNISGPISHHLGNLTKLRYLDLNNINQYSLVNGDNLDWISSRLVSLEYLDLSCNNLSKATDWFQVLSTLPSLKELYLWSCDLPEIVEYPSPFATINASTSLAFLDISWNDRLFLSNTDLIFNWILNFSNSLNFLDLSSTYLKSSSIPDAFHNMTSLSQIDLSNNMLEYVPKCFGNMSSLTRLSLFNNSVTGQLSEIMSMFSGPIEDKLQILDLGWNMISGLLPNMSRFSSLTALILPKNQLYGTIGQGFLQLPNLAFLDLSHNKFTGQVPILSFSRRSLRVLYLHFNGFNGTLTESIGGLSQLEVLFLSSNQLEGLITEAHLSTLSRLKWLSLSENPMLSVDWEKSHFVPPFQLHFMGVGSCKLGPRFLKSIHTQKELVFLGISNANISENISTLLDSLPRTLNHLDASNNHIYGFFHNNMSSSLFNILSVPFLEFMDISQMFALDLAGNQISGSMQSVCNWTKLNSINLSGNLLSGHIPDCFASFENLQYLNLANNHFHGTIPPSIGSLHSLSLLHLETNFISGEIPASIRNCKSLVVIELEENNLTGEVPTWIGDNLSNLVALFLRSNAFYGSMPSNLCNLKYMQILDLSSNNISGEIPKCLFNLTAMITQGNRLIYDIKRIRFPTFSSSHTRFVSRTKYESARVLWRGEEQSVNSLGWFTHIDFSSNNLTGEIPSRITELVNLLGLNLSKNSLTGPIPQNIGQLKLLNVLDLSRNDLSGPIPTSLSELSHLGTLNLSYNNLSGRIPLDGHSLTFNEPETYIGNPGLCGPPLENSCPKDASVINNPEHENGDEEDDQIISEGFYISMGLGFVIGFWGIVGPMLFFKSCRYMRTPFT